MSITVELPAYLRTYASGESAVRIELSSGAVSDVLSALFAKHPGVRDRVLDERGAVRQHVNIFVGAESIRFTGGLATAVPDGERVIILPAVSGGR